MAGQFEPVQNSLSKLTRYIRFRDNPRYAVAAFCDWCLGSHIMYCGRDGRSESAEEPVVHKFALWLMFADTSLSPSSASHRSFTPHEHFTVSFAHIQTTEKQRNIDSSIRYDKANTVITRSAYEGDHRA